tara:strand:+ start:615 stop:725 length:111 start_codon:yes stop_codon:yes gene_type:complete
MKKEKHKPTKGAFGNGRKHNGIKLRKPKFATPAIWM